MKKRKAGKLLTLLMIGMLALNLNSFHSFAASEGIAKGSYQVESSLSCYINAMGGVEFGDGIFEKAIIHVDENGNMNATLCLAAGEVTIYSVTCDTFIDSNESKPGYYDASGNLQMAEYTLSSETVLNSNNESVNYVENLIVPVSRDQDTYYLWIYVNSNVMGTQFGNGKDSSSYAAAFTIDWSTLKADSTTAAATTETQEMEGLSLYPAETAKNSQTDISESNVWNALQENQMLIYLCIGLGTLLIVLGAVFLKSGSSKKEYVITIRIEHGGMEDNDSQV